MKDLAWIHSELNNDRGPFASFCIVRTVVAPTRISNARSFAAQVAEFPVHAHTRLDTAISSCLGGEVGLWFHAGWHDQAAIEVFDTKRGTAQLVGHMLAKLDNRQPNENGDMITAFASTEADWVLLVKLSRERHLFCSEIRAATIAVADIVLARCGQI